MITFANAWLETIMLPFFNVPLLTRTVAMELKKNPYLHQDSRLKWPDEISSHHKQKQCYPFPLSFRDSKTIPSTGQFLLALRSCSSARVVIASKSPSKLVPFRIYQKAKLAMKLISLIVNKSLTNNYHSLISHFIEKICCQFDVSEHCLWSQVKTDKIMILLIATARFDKAKHQLKYKLKVLWT